MTNDIVPIGKYKGQPLERLMADQSYSEWLLAQAWFVDRYAELAQLLRMGRLTEPQDTPEHNAMVAGLIDQRDAMEWLFAALYPAWKLDGDERLYTSGFAQEIEPKGGDILISFNWFHQSIMIEAKPLIGDDFPTVIRQAKATGRKCAVVARRVEPTNLTLEQVRRQFELAGVRLVLEHELFASAAEWAGQRAAYYRDAIPNLEAQIAEATAEIQRLKDEPPVDDGWGAGYTIRRKIEEITAKVAQLNSDLERHRRGVEHHA